ncbi:MAG: hypothetical protein IPP62_15300 [bacterium]|nr:hypothetical protein [bacterium]
MGRCSLRGDNRSGQCNVPSPNSGFASIAAGWNHSLGIRADGSIVGWGFNNVGQCDAPQPNTRFVAVAGGGAHSLGLKADGTIVAWGIARVSAPFCSKRGLCGCRRRILPSVGLRADGTIVAWGSNVDGGSQFAAKR